MERFDTGAFKLGGDDVIAVLPYCEDYQREFLEGAFQYLWGISPEDWDQATPEQKSLKFGW